ncbi:MAG: hypothetical protein KDN20_04440 [Verrucomicrobiae bacterium]|nr:hypothetical protein [Verrucomicrobiae bacterium]
MALASAMVLLSGSAQASDDSVASNKLGRPPGGVLRTKAGKIYEEARVIRVDPNGVLFRHRDGTGRLLLADLTPELQAHYGFDVKMAWEFESGRSETEGANGDTSAQPTGVPPMVFTFRTRTTLPPTPSPAVVWAPVLCGNPAQLGYAWPSHWSRFHHGLAYSSFPWRQLAERDFLISSGLLPHPPGVRTWRLR